MALITGCSTGKHPAAPLPDTKACPRCRRGFSTHATASTPFPLHHHKCGVRVKTGSLYGDDLDVFANPITSGIPVDRSKTAGENHLGRQAGCHRAPKHYNTRKNEVICVNKATVVG